MAVGPYPLLARRPAPEGLISGSQAQRPTLEADPRRRRSPEGPRLGAAARYRLTACAI